MGYGARLQVAAFAMYCQGRTVEQIVTGLQKRYASEGGPRQLTIEGWMETDFEELHSRFGTGGALTPEGAAEAVVAMNLKRAVHQKVALLLESGEASLLVGLVDLLYQKIVVSKA
ncbi:MAG: hypothetical protein IIB43_02315 [Candidatus Marinimicrobia bacterium]|nr:hypothetical protein [Candidatus Neomarinimicrobiota bacterium]